MARKKFQPMLLYLRLELFDAVEIHPVRENGNGFEQIDIKDWGQDPLSIYFWSVYLHYDIKHPDNNEFGGLECIADFSTEEAANAFALGLMIALGQRLL